VASGTDGRLVRQFLGAVRTHLHADCFGTLPRSPYSRGRLTAEASAPPPGGRDASSAFAGLTRNAAKRNKPSNALLASGCGCRPTPPLRSAIVIDQARDPMNRR
jgi:hypothetical protein